MPVPVVGAIMWVAGAWSDDKEIIEKVTKATEQNEQATLAAMAAEQKAIEDAAKGSRST